MLRAMCPAVMIVTVTAVCFVNVARALFCQVQSAHILSNVFAVINFYPSYVTGNFNEVPAGRVDLHIVHSLMYLACFVCVSISCAIHKID